MPSDSELLLSVLVPCLAERDNQPLVDELNRQAQEVGCTEILTETDNGEITSGVKRQRLTNRARGRYLAFVDDDDWVATDYVSAIIQAIRQEPDVVTFRCSMTLDGSQKREFRFGFCPDDINKGYMSANHLCAWRADVARLVGWCPDLGYGDDQLWYKPLLSAGLWKEQHIPEVLYQYRFSFNSTVNQKKERINKSRRYFGQGLRCFTRGDGRMLIERGGLNRSRLAVEVRDPENVIKVYPMSELLELKTVTLA